MKIAVFGGTGFIGTALISRVRALGHEVTAFDVRKEKDLTEALKNTDAVINLAGASIFGKRWNPEYKKTILDSRVEGTRKIVEAMSAIHSATGKAAVLVNASAVGYYGVHEDEELVEDSSPGKDFLAEVCVAWEQSAQAAEKSGIRVALMRIGVVLGKKGGALEQMLPPFKMFAGGPIGDGQQWFSWVHVDDVVNLLIQAAQDARFTGAFNVTAPHPVRNIDFSQALGRALHRPSWLPTPAFMLKILLGEGAEFLVTGQKVLPRKVLALGYKFKFDSIEAALKDAASK